MANALSTCLFIGPTGFQSKLPSGVDIFPPAALGSVFRAVNEGYRRIAIIDGYFGNIPSVWHKEILYALSRDIEVWGAASTGALRAAELAAFGMRGVGTAFRLFRRGILTDDDEVCLTHGPKELGYPALSLPMINVRFTLRSMRRQSYIEPMAEKELCDTLKKMHFSVRDEATIRDVLLQTLRREHAWQEFLNCYVDVKRADATRLLNILAASEFPTGRSRSREWIFPRTLHWIEQFEKRISDIPDFGVDCA